MIVTSHCPPGAPQRCSGQAGDCLKNWARREIFASALSNVNEFNAKGPKTGLAYLVSLQNLFFLKLCSQDFCFGELRPPPPSLPSQMTVLHCVPWTSLAAWAVFLVWGVGERPPNFPDWRLGEEWMGSEQWIKLSSVLVPKWGLMEGRRVRVLRWAEQNGAALFEMFSYLILCPSPGSSLICLAWPCSCHCSTAYLVQLMIPGAACHSVSVHLQGSCLWSLYKFPFSFFCFLLLLS